MGANRTAMARCDVQVHSKFSNRPAEWVLRRLGVPESYTAPAQIYERARAAGMDFVTITDHNTIRGAQEIADRPGVFLSEEATAYFPDGAKVHILIWDITPAQHEEIHEIRTDIFRLNDYLRERGIAHGVAHPLYNVDGKLTVEHFEKLLLIFDAFEVLNGLRSPVANAVTRACLEGLTPEVVERLERKHGFRARGVDPWRKTLFGGSDDHGGLFIARAYTEVPEAGSVAQFLAGLRKGTAFPGGEGGTPQLMASGVYSTAYQFIRDNLRLKAPLYAKLLGKSFERFLAGQHPAEFSFGDQVDLVSEAVLSGQIFAILSPGASMPRDLADFFNQPVLQRRIAKVLAAEPSMERRSFAVACEVSNHLGFRFFEQTVKQIAAGDFFGSLQSASALAPVTVSVLPYLVAFQAMFGNRKLLEQAAGAILPEAPAMLRNVKRAWLTDTLEDVNGVARTIRTMTQALRAAGHDMTVITSRSDVGIEDIPVRNFEPVGEFELPEYKIQKLSFPPILEMLDYLWREGFTELVISTPGPVGVVGLMAAKMFGLKASGIYHTDFPQYVKILSDDDAMETLTWNYMQWFYGQLDVIYSNSRYYRDLWIERGVPPSKLRILPRGLDTELFHVRRRDPAFWKRRGARAPVALYVGRISLEKDLDLLPAVAAELARRKCGVSWAFVGDGPYRAELERLMPKAVFTGVLTGAELGAAYASADIFVFPSTTDTYGNVVVEACAAGLPVVVSDVGGPKELVKSGVRGIVCAAKSAAAFADAIESLAGTETHQAPPENLASLMGWGPAAEAFWKGG